MYDYCNKFGRDRRYNLTENTVTLKVANHGTTVRSNLPLSYTVNDGKEITETYVGDIAPGDTVTHTFTTKVDISANNTYIIKVAVKDPDDIDAYNNSWVAPVIINYENGSIPYQCDFETDLERLYWIFGGTWATGNNFSSSRSAYSYLSFGLGNEPRWRLGIFRMYRY